MRWCLVAYGLESRAEDWYMNIVNMLLKRYSIVTRKFSSITLITPQSQSCCYKVCFNFQFSDFYSVIGLIDYGNSIERNI